MGLPFEELDWQETPMGEISLRRRIEPTLGVEVYEVRLGEEYLMSSLFTVAESELARLGLAEVGADQLDVLVGGLGLGYTAAVALEDPRIRTLTVVDAIAPVIDWHRRGLLPDRGLTSDPRVQLVLGDFFALASAGAGFADGTPAQYDAILLDIDHTPSHVLHPSHAAFYTSDGLAAMARQLKPEGAFALWSDDPPDERFLEVLSQVFSSTRAEVVSFPNPLTRGESANTVYLATR
ncbi:MAG: spermidine synthase [Actinomycetota bacterium]